MGPHRLRRIAPSSDQFWSVADWIEMHRNFGRDELQDDRTVGVGTSDLDVRTQFAAWREYMTEAA